MEITYEKALAEAFAVIMKLEFSDIQKIPDEFLNTLKNKGFEDALILFPKHHEKLIKVSAGGFTNESDADSEAIKVKNAINQSTWIYKK